MFRIYDGREHFYQWDLNRKLIVEDAGVKEVHFCNRTDNCSLVCETYVEGDFTLVNVPNILLQTDWKIRVYAYDGAYTKHDECYEVKGRTKPADYVYTETEVLDYKDLEDRIKAIEENGGGGTGGNKDFIVNFTIVDENMNCTPDKTFEEVQAAIQEGYNIYGTIGITLEGVYGNVKIPLTIFNEYGCWFTGIHLNRSLCIYLLQSGECAAGLFELADGSIYEAIDSMIGDIDVALDAIIAIQNELLEV